MSSFRPIITRLRNETATDGSFLYTLEINGELTAEDFKELGSELASFTDKQFDDAQPKDTHQYKVYSYEKNEALFIPE
jgi:hypothetical protein